MTPEQERQAAERKQALDEAKRTLKDRVTMRDVLAYFDIPEHGDCPSGHVSSNHNCFHLKKHLRSAKCYHCGESFDILSVVTLKTGQPYPHNMTWLAENFAQDVLSLFPPEQEETPEQRAERTKKQAATREHAQRVRLEQARKTAEEQARKAQKVATVIKDVLALRDAGKPCVLSPYLANKRLTIHDKRDAFVLTGKQLLQAGVTQVRQWERFEELPFLVVAVKDINGNIISFQFLSTEKSAYKWDSIAKAYLPIQKENDRKSKVFLAGGATSGGCLPLLASDVTLESCRTFILSEAFAKATAIRMAADADAASISAFSVNQYPEILDALLQKLSPDTPLKALRKSGVDGKTFVIFADNDHTLFDSKTGIDRLRRVYPFLNICYADYGLKDADDVFRAEGVEGVRRVLRRAGKTIKPVYSRLQKDQYLADVNLPFTARSRNLHSGVGTGKSVNIQKEISSRRGQSIVIAVPFTPILEQIAQDCVKHGNPFKVVYNGEDWPEERNGVIISTWRGCRKCPDDFPVNLLITDEGHELASATYMQADIEEVLRLHRRAGESMKMSATFYEWQDSAGTLIVAKEGEHLTDVHLRYLQFGQNDKNALALIVEKARAAKAAGKRLLVIRNNKKRNYSDAAALVTQGLTSDTFDSSEKGRDSAFFHAVNTHHLPQVDVMFCTKLYESGLSLFDEDFEEMLIFDKTGRMTPHEVKQGANRQRKLRLNVTLVLPESFKNDIDATFDSDKRKFHYFKKQQQLVRDAQARLDAGTFSEHVLQSETARVLRTELSFVTGKGGFRAVDISNNTARPMASFVDMAVLRDYRSQLATYGKFREREFNKFGLRLIDVADVTPVAMDADAQVVMAVATSDAKAAMTEKYEQRINDLDAMTPTELYKEAISSETARKFHRLKKQFQEDAAVIMKHIGENPREYAKAQAWIDAAVFPEDGAKYIEILQECIRPADTPKAGYERTESLAARLQPLFEQNSILRHALIVDKETGKKTLSCKRALSWLRKYADIGTMHTKEGSVVIVHSLTPIFAWFEEKTGKPLTPEDAPAFFEYRERARMSKGDTSDHNVSYRRKVSPLQPADPSQANISFERKQTDTSDHNVSYRRKVSPVSDAAAMQEMESAALTPFSEVSTVYEQSDIYHPFCELCQQHKTNPNCRACKF